VVANAGVVDNVHERRKRKLWVNGEQGGGKLESKEFGH